MTVCVMRTTNLEPCLELRRVVFIEEQGVPEAEEVDEYDATALHFLAMDGPLPVGTARIVVKDSLGKIGRVCVLQSHRGTGLGKALIIAALDQLRQMPEIETALLGAQSQATGFYQKLGFHVTGDEYLDAGIPHFDMVLKL